MIYYNRYFPCVIHLFHITIIRGALKISIFKPNSVQSGGKCKKLSRNTVMKKMIDFIATSNCIDVLKYTLDGFVVAFVCFPACCLGKVPA